MFYLEDNFTAYLREDDVIFSDPVYGDITEEQAYGDAYSHMYYAQL